MESVMLITAQEAVLLEQDEDIASSVIGGAWDLFKRSIPEPQSNILVNALNFILLADRSEVNLDDPNSLDNLDMDDLMGRPTSFLPIQINNLLVDEMIDISSKKLHVYDMVIENVLYLLKKMGFTIDEDQVTTQSLPHLCKIGHFFYDMQGYQDLIGIAATLESKDVDPVSRFILVLQRYLGEDTDMSAYESLIEDVTEVTLMAIKDSLEGGDAGDSGLPAGIIKRVRANVETIKGTLAHTHVLSNGQLGGSVESFLGFFQGELKAIQDNLEGENITKYIKELIGIYLISEVNTPNIKEALLRTAHELVSDFLTLTKLESLINGLVLTDD